MTNIDVYTQPGCGPCLAIKMHLRKAGVAFTEHDVTQDRDAAAKVVELGYSGTPVVTAGDMHIGAYRRDWLDNTIAAIRAEEADPACNVDCELDAVAECCAA